VVTRDPASVTNTYGELPCNGRSALSSGPWSGCTLSCPPLARLTCNRPWRRSTQRNEHSSAARSPCPTGITMTPDVHCEKFHPQRLLLWQPFRRWRGRGRSSRLKRLQYFRRLRYPPHHRGRGRRPRIRGAAGALLPRLHDDHDCGGYWEDLATRSEPEIHQGRPLSLKTVLNARSQGVFILFRPPSSMPHFWSLARTGFALLRGFTIVNCMRGSL
jgi:hypothetical protein